jgi:hypothetical protein
MGFHLDIDVPANGRVRTATITALDDKDEQVLHQDQANLNQDKERRRITKRFAEVLHVEPDDFRKRLEEAWNQLLGQRRRQKQDHDNGSPKAANQVEVVILDQLPRRVSRPLCLLDDHAYAAS